MTSAIEVCTRETFAKASHTAMERWMVYDDGRHYEGCWDYGRYHGHSSTSFPTITIAAEVNTTMMQMHGRGAYWWEDGRVHVGHFRDNQRHGQGSYLLPDGSRYTGFIFRKMHGHETHMFHCGSRYVSVWTEWWEWHSSLCKWTSARRAISARALAWTRDLFNPRREP